MSEALSSYQELSNNSMCGAVIIPGLPNDLSLGILARLPRILQARLRVVCRSWNDAMDPASLNTLRKLLGVSEVWPFFADPHMGMDIYNKVFSVFVSPVVPRIFSHDASPTHLPPRLQEIGIPPPPQVHQHLGRFDFEVFATVGSKVLLAALSLHESVDHLEGIYVFDAVSMRWIDCVYPNCHVRPDNSSEKVVDAEGGYVYVASGNRSIKYFDRLDCRRGMWESLPSPHIERVCAAVVVLHGCLYMIGGLNLYVPGHARHPCCSGEVWDPSTREWTIRPELWPAEVFKDEMTTRAAVVMDQLFALRGGFPKEELMCYQPLSEKWISLGTLPVDAQEDTRMCDHSLSAIGEELWVFDDCMACLAAKPGTVSQPLVWRVLASTAQNTFQDYGPLTYVGVVLV